MPLAVLLSATCLYGQQLASPIEAAPQLATVRAAELPDAPDALLPQSSSGASQAATPPQTSTDKPDRPTPPPQPKRILGLMPNYRAVSAGVKPEPATPKQAFKIATQQSFDYSG
ncbi:MAG TPA: hypothetical protein VLI45_08055, partial [Acidobacteriaceae bacterium]|nr:hypothetical protein [Acidobacteriaceae bacterium]